MKKILPLLVVLLTISFSSVAYAETFNLYSNLDDNNQYCNILIDYYYNLSDFDPFNEFVCFRDSQYSYTLVYGKSLNNGDLNYIRYEPAYMNSSSRLSVGSLSSLHLNKNNYTYVGNVEGSLTSHQYNDFKLHFLLIIGGFIFLLVFLYKVFKPRFNLHSSKGYDL